MKYVYNYKNNFSKTFFRLYDRSQKNNGISGMFDRNKPVLVLGSPDLVKLATVKDFDHFTDHRTIETKGNVFEKNLLALKGD